MIGTTIDTSENRWEEEERHQQSSSGNKHLARFPSIASSQATSTHHLSYDERQQVLHELMGNTAMDPKEFHKRLFMLREPEVAPGSDGKPVFTRHRWLADVLREEHQRMEDMVAFKTENPTPLLDSDSQSTGLQEIQYHKPPSLYPKRTSIPTTKGCGSGGGSSVGVCVGDSTGSGPLALRKAIFRSVSAFTGLAPPGSDRPANWRQVLQSMLETSSGSRVVSSSHSLNSSLTSNTNFSQFANSNLTPDASSIVATREVADQNQRLDAITEASERLLDSLERRMRAKAAALAEVQAGVEKKRAGNYLILFESCAVFDKMLWADIVIQYLDHLQKAHPAHVVSDMDKNDYAISAAEFERPPSILLGFSSSSSKPSHPVTSKTEATPTASSQIKPEATPRQTRGHASSQVKPEATPSQTRGHANSQVKPEATPSQTRGQANSQIKSEAAPPAKSRAQLQRSASSISTSSNRLEQEINSNTTSNRLNQEIKVCWEQCSPDSPLSLPDSTSDKSLTPIALPPTQTSHPSILTSPTSNVPSSPSGGGGGDGGGEESGPVSLWGLAHGSSMRSRGNSLSGISTIHEMVQQLAMTQAQAGVVTTLQG
eukprot:gene11447-34155_t